MIRFYFIYLLFADYMTKILFNYWHIVCLPLLKIYIWDEILLSLCFHCKYYYILEYKWNVVCTYVSTSYPELYCPTDFDLNWLTFSPCSLAKTNRLNRILGMEKTVANRQSKIYRTSLINDRDAGLWSFLQDKQK